MHRVVVIGILGLSIVESTVGGLMAKFSLYDESANSALHGIENWIHEANLALPLFPNLIDSPDTSKRPEICVGVQSAERPNSPFAYTKQTVVAMLSRMDFPSLDGVYIHVFGLKGRCDLTDVAELVPVTEVEIDTSETNRTVVIQSRLHVFILRQLSRIGCKHIVMLEDDALATFDWVDRVRDAINQVSASHADWLMVKLYAARPFGQKAYTKGLNWYDQRFGAVAYLINNRYVIDFADMLDEALEGKGHVEVDLAILDFTDQRGKQVLSFEPVVFQHTGIYSAANPGRTAEEFEKHWGMQSENFDAENKPIEFSSDHWAKSMPRKNLLISVHNRKTQTVHVPLVSADL